jgi:hypothetical protein
MLALMRRVILAALCVWVLGVGAVARAGREAEDLKRQIDAQRAAVVDFERLDPQRAVPDEIQNLRSWLDEAANLHTEKEYDKVREVLDRCIAQAELLRQKTAAYKLKAQLQERETGLKRSKDRVEKTKQAITQAQVNKKAMEMNVK